MPGSCDRGSFLCDAGHELRVTQRCITTDFGQIVPQTFEGLIDVYEIVDGFRTKRDVSTSGGKTVGPAAGARTIFHLGRGDDHRGATWFDPGTRVVWLCAYRLHRSGTADDAFPYFKELIASGAIWPRREDYEWLEADRAARFSERLPEAADALLAAARATPNRERRAVIGVSDVGVVVVVIETLEETYVAIDMRTLAGPGALPTLLAAFYPERAFQEWVIRTELPNRKLRSPELCWSILRG